MSIYCQNQPWRDLFVFRPDFSGTDTTSLPEITYTDQAPFMNGKRVECVWEKADRMSGFTIPAKFARATLESGMLHAFR